MRAPTSSATGHRGAAPPRETAGYLSHRGELLHHVFHHPSNAPVAKVLLAGPLPDERTHAHLTWVRWARLLAERGFLAMRFDYSGTGESTGSFEKATMSLWADEIAACVSRLKSEDGCGPIVLCGLRLGGMLASRVFSEGHGDALLTWSAPKSGEAVLIDAARRQQAANIIQGIAGGVPGPRAIISALQACKSAEINGYTWTPHFWQDARSFELEATEHADQRTILNLEPARAAAAARAGGTGATTCERVAISWPPFWVVGNRLVHRTEELFERSLRFLEDLVAGGPQ